MPELPRQSLVVLAGTAAAARAGMFAQKLGARVLNWNIEFPEASREQVKGALHGEEALVVTLQRHHPKALRDLSRMARKAGKVSVLHADAEIEGMQEFTEVLTSADGLTVVPMPYDKSHDNGPFDLIGDVHGCALELMILLERMGHVGKGWAKAPPGTWHAWVRAHPTNRKTVLLGDLTDRGPHNLACLRIAQALERRGGYMVAGNHDDKLARWIAGRPVSVGHGLQVTINELQCLDAGERDAHGAWLRRQPRHLILDNGRLVVAHAGLEERLHAKATPEAEAFAIYGKVKSDETDDHGRPLRIDWASSYEGRATVVHGHVVHPEPRETNGVHAIDTGCVFGGALTAMRFPEKQYVSVKAAKAYYSPADPA